MRKVNKEDLSLFENEKFRCKTCKKVFPLTDVFFRKDSNMWTGYKAHCKHCISKGKIKNPDLENEYICKKCGRSLPYNILHFKKKGKFGKLTSPCRECYGESFLKYDLNNIPEGFSNCGKCGGILPNEHFYKNKAQKSGLSNWCKKCLSHYNSLEYVKNKRNNESKIRRKTDVHFALRMNISSRIRCALKTNSKKSSSIKFLGCSIQNYKNYLEDLMSKEMNWENYGKLWEIDHIIPCSLFNFSIEEDQFKCFNYKNTQPMYKHDNNSKLNRNDKKVLYMSSKFYNKSKNNMILIKEYELDER